MSNRFHVATRKGLFTIERKRAGWAIQNVSFLGDNWISEDGGDSWRTISNHLPPVYAVRFEKP